MKLISRRKFNKYAWGYFLASLFSPILGRRALMGHSEYLVWLDQINKLSYLLRKGKIKQITWQKEIEKVLSNIQLKDILQFIDYEKILRSFATKKKNFLYIPLRNIHHSLASKSAFKAQIFIMRKGFSIVPHGHNYMTSLFLVLSGSFHGRHYERLKETKKHYWIKPSIDKDFSGGKYSTISDELNNIHWFKANSEIAMLLNFNVKNLKKGPKKPGRVYLDPLGKKSDKGLILAKIISRKKAYQLFYQPS